MKAKQVLPSHEILPFTAQSNTERYFMGERVKVKPEIFRENVCQMHTE